MRFFAVSRSQPDIFISKSTMPPSPQPTLKLRCPFHDDLNPSLLLLGFRRPWPEVAGPSRAHAFSFFGQRVKLGISSDGGDVVVPDLKNAIEADVGNRRFQRKGFVFV